MPEGKGYGPQFTASVGKTLNYLGQHAYAYSGIVSVDDNETTLLEFTSLKNGYLVGAYQPNYESLSGDDFKFLVYINDIVISSVQISASRDYTPYEEIEIIVPPLTTLKVTAQNETGSTATDILALFTARMFGKL
jgi:hypothetical protein